KKQIVALALIARRGHNSRLAAFAVAPQQRGAGLGKWLLGEALAQTKARSDAAMDLEVIIGNTAAERLYEGMGFERVCRLRGYLRREKRGERREEKGSGLVEVDVSEVAQAILNEQRPWPWQQSAASVIQSALPVRGWRWRSAFT